jgi:hydrogenase maturation factor HypF (carbamoyltransferase family)
MPRDSRIRNTLNSSAEVRALLHSLDKQWRCMVARGRDDYNARRLAETNHCNVWRTIKHHHAHRRSIRLPQTDLQSAPLKASYIE